MKIKVSLSKLLNIALSLLVIIVVVSRLPAIIKQYQFQGKLAPEFSIPTLDGNVLDLNKEHAPLVLVFWATWCGPCKIELGRIQNMIDSNKIKKESILAISSLEEKDILEKTVQDRKYTFPIGIDSTGQIAQEYEVQATPTIIFRSSEGKVVWITTGLSPTLEFRINSFLKQIE